MGLLGRILIYGFAILYWFSPLDFDFVPGIGKIDDIVVALASFYFAKKGLPKGLVQALLSRRSPKAPGPTDNLDPYEILLLSHGADRDKVMRAYFKQRALYASDRAFGMSDEFQRRAESKLAQIEQAYQMLMKLCPRSGERSYGRPDVTNAVQRSKDDGKGK